MTTEQIIHRFREDEFPHASSGIQINTMGWKCRIGWFASNHLPTITHIKIRGRTKQLRLGRLAIAFAPKMKHDIQ